MLASAGTRATGVQKRSHERSNVRSTVVSPSKIEFPSKHDARHIFRTSGSNPRTPPLYSYSSSPIGRYIHRLAQVAQMLIARPSIGGISSPDRGFGDVRGEEELALRLGRGSAGGLVRTMCTPIHREPYRKLHISGVSI